MLQNRNSGDLRKSLNSGVLSICLVTGYLEVQMWRHYGCTGCMDGCLCIACNGMVQGHTMDICILHVECGSICRCGAISVCVDVVAN